MLVEFVGHIGEFFGQFPCRLVVADVVVAVGVGIISQGGSVSSFLPL